ncbi:MAG: hypothetical protein ABDH28_03395 [Brevinematia bacterium]
MEYGAILDRIILISLSEAEDRGFAKDKMEEEGKRMFEEFITKGYIRKTPSEMILVPMYSFAVFLKMLYESKGNPKSPVSAEKNSNWMRDTSLCFLNVRATAPSDHVHGDFINAVKVLPVLRVDGIHLSPFFDHALRILYALDCLWVISDDFVNKFYLSLIPAYDQLRFFVGTAHLMDKVVGFDLEPHTSQFSRVALEYPHFFRWIKLQKYSNGNISLADNLSQEEQLSPEYQKRIYEEVREVVREKLRKYKLKSFARGDILDIRTAHLESIYELIERGIWTVPSHTWNGVGIPEFSHYVYDKNYPEFKYINAKGEDHRGHAFGILTPYKFYDNIRINSLPDPENPPVLDRNVLKFFSNIPIRMIEKFSFDFVRWDYTDHVFDSVLNNNPNYPISDRLTPYVISYTVKKVKKKFPHVGMFFERMGDEFKDYYKVGADTILGPDIWEDISKSYIKKALKLSTRLGRFNSKKSRKVSVMFAVDTHDTENPVINRSPLKREGKKGILLRFFLSRFASAGEGRRPKYECIGINEGTTGLYEANISLKTLEWKNDKDINEAYHNIEDTYLKLQKTIKEGNIEKVSAKGKVVFWKISSPNGNIWCFVNTSSRSLSFAFPQKFSYLLFPYTSTKKEYLERVKISSFEPIIAIE